MTARTHDLGAVTFVSYYFLSNPIKLNWETGLGIIIATIIGALIPDIDNVTSPVWRNKLLPWEGKATLDFLQGHRQLSHSLFGAVLFFVVFNLLLRIVSLTQLDVKLVSWAFFLSYISHLLLDTITREGVPWFYPLPYKFGFPPFKYFRIKTGSWVEKIIVYPTLLVILVWIFYSYRANLILFKGVN